MSMYLAHHDEGFAQAVFIRHGLPSPSDDRVPEGIHWRVIPPVDVLPAGPIVVCNAPVDGNVSSPRTDRGGTGPWDVTPDQELILIVDQDPNLMTGWVGIQAEGRLRVAVIAEKTAPNGEYIEITARDTPTADQWMVASSDISRVRVTGEGRVIETWAISIPRTRDQIGEVLDVAALDPEAADAMAGAYAPLNVAFESSKDRILRCAPDQPVPYAPVLPWPGYGADDEVRRVTELVDDSRIRDWLRIAGEAIMAGTAGEVVQEVASDIDVGTAQGLRYPVAAALGVAASDPGLARWLARQGMFRTGPAEWRPDQPALAIALMPAIVARIPQFFRSSATLEATYESQVPGALGELRARVRNIPEPRDFGNDPLQLKRVWVVDLVQLPMPLVGDTFPALPRPPRPALSGGARWELAEVDPPRTVAWEQTVALREVAPFGPVSFVQVAHNPGDPDRVTMHDHELGSEVARPMLAGWPQAATVGAPPEMDAVLRGRIPIVTVGDARTTEWEVQLGDWIGRWGEPARVVADPPPPSPPAPPVLRATFVRVATSGTAAASPGFVHIEVAVTPSTAPGALPLGGVHVHVEGAPDAPLAPTARPQVLAYDYAVPPTLPGQGHVVHIEASVTDSAGTPSAGPDPVAEVHADDARPLPVPSVSPRLLMTSRPGPAPTVTARLSVRAVAGAAYYRFYTAPESVVRAAVGLSADGFRADPRAMRAAAMVAAARRPPRNGFTLAATAKVDSGTGLATGTIVIPSATTDLVVFRAVPVTAGKDAYGKDAEGVEADITAVIPTYVAVPFDDVPPLPRVTAEVIADGDSRQLSVNVAVSGVPGLQLTRLPGQIEARLVEALEGVDPDYWPEITRLPLVVQDDGSHTGSATIPVPTWVRVQVAASVRFAEEGTTVLGADIVLNPDLSPASPQPERVESPWGPLSAPIDAGVDGPEPIVTSTTGPAGVSVTVTGLPPAAGGSSAFTAIVYIRQPDGSLAEWGPRRRLTAEAPAFNLSPAVPAAAVILVDPFDQPRPATQVG